jgi:hypothetical protein
VRGKLSGWAIFLAVLLLLSFAATPSFKYSRTADLSLMAVRFSLVILLSVLVVREKGNIGTTLIIRKPRQARTTPSCNASGAGTTMTGKLPTEWGAPSFRPLLAKG